MTFERSIIQPSVGRSQAEEAVTQQRRYWVVETCLTSEFKTENVDFLHDPDWETRFLSLQGVNDISKFKYEHVTPRVVFWHSIQLLYVVAGLAFGLGIALTFSPFSTASSLLILALVILAPVFASMVISLGARRLFWWAFDMVGRAALEERHEKEFAESNRVMAIVRDNMWKKHNRTFITVAGSTYRVIRAH